MQSCEAIVGANQKSYWSQVDKERGANESMGLLKISKEDMEITVGGFRQFENVVEHVVFDS